jgi:hypothetical protein
MAWHPPAETYGKLASQMERLAQQAATPGEKAGYLRLASAWRQLGKARVGDNERPSQHLADVESQKKFKGVREREEEGGLIAVGSMSAKSMSAATGPKSSGSVPTS